MAFLLRCTGSNFCCKQIITAIFLSFSGSLVVAESISNPVAEIDSSNQVQLEQEQAQSTKQEMPTHTVIVGDTLWSVAKRLRPENMPMAQAMDTLYQYNPEAFLEGDSTKLIEGSVVSFPVTTVVEEAPQFISQQNSALVIPTIEDVIETNTEVDAISELGPEVEPEAIEEIVQETAEQAVDENQSAELVDIDDDIDDSLVSDQQDTIIVDSEPAKDAVESPIVSDPLANSSDIAESAQEVEFIQQLKKLFSEFDAQQFAQLMTRVKQLPIDFWVFFGALLFAMVINRSRKLDKANKLKAASAEKIQKPIESVLDGPFAESTDDEVFADIAEEPQAANPPFKDKVAEPNEAINLPGAEELEAQLREDSAGQQPQTNAVLEVDFEDDSLEIDPLQIKLDMASLCIEMGDIESAQAILEEIIGEADKQGKAKAREILDSIET